MSPQKNGPLKHPTQKGFMGPLAVIKVIEAADALQGQVFAEELKKSAQIFRVPEYDEPIREIVVGRLHKTLRETYPDVSGRILREAGRRSADFVMDYRMPRRAQTMISNMPWSMGVWILGRSLVQNSWTFGGSANLTTPNRMEFKLCNSVFTKGETHEHPICDYHTALFARLFSALVHEDLTCSEVSCSASGAECCHFKIHVAHGADNPRPPAGP